MRLTRDYVSDWRSWRAPELPPLPQIDGWDGPWRRDITRSDVDALRTARMWDDNWPVHVAGGTAPWEGASAGQPYDVVDNISTVPVWDLSRPLTWSWSGPKFPTVEIPAPHTIRREGDPLGAWDRHARIVTATSLTELIAVDQAAVSLLRMFGYPTTCGYPGGGRGVVTYDLTRRHMAGSGGVVAARVPHLPMVLRYDELQSGRINHCLFGVLPDYAPERTGWAEGVDGRDRAHPCRAGEILRLRPGVAARYPDGTPERTTADAMTVHGVFIGDRHGQPGGPLRITVAQDRRIGELRLGLTVRDFEIIDQEATR